MQGYPGMPMNRPGLGLRPPMPSYGQGPSMMTLAQRQQAPPSMRPTQEGITLFVGSIAGGITDAFLQELLNVCVIQSSSIPPKIQDVWIGVGLTLDRHAERWYHLNASLRPRTNHRVSASRRLMDPSLQHVRSNCWMVLSCLGWRMVRRTRSLWCVCDNFLAVMFQFYTLFDHLRWGPMKSIRGWLMPILRDAWVLTWVIGWLHYDSS